MKIIVSGASGFLGSKLCAFLDVRGHEIVRLNSKNCDLRDVKNLDKFSSNKYDLVIHLAAWTQAGDFCLRHPGEQWIINQYINTNMLDWWQREQPQAKLVFMGTSCAYAPGNDLREENYMNGEPIDSLYTYAMTKRMLFQGARAMESQYGLKWLCAVPSTLYGAEYHLDGRQMHFIFDLIRKIIRGKEYNEPVVLWGNGYQKREIVLADDFIRILWHLVETQENDIYNIGAGEENTIRYFAGLICNEIGYPLEKIQYDTSRYTGVESKCLNIEKVKNKVLDYNLTPLQDGLKKVIHWFYESKAF